MANRRFSIKFSGVKTDASHDGRITIDYFAVFSNAVVPFRLMESGHYYAYWPYLGKISCYEKIFPGIYQSEETKESSPMLCTFAADDSFDLSSMQGICALEEGVGNKYSIYRREYEIYERPGNKIQGYYNNVDGKFYEDLGHSSEIKGRDGWLYFDKSDNILYSYNGTNFIVTPRVREYMGDWEPVVVKSDLSHLYDFNVTSGRSYQYILYPADALYDNIDEAATSAKQVFANSISDTTGSKEPLYKVWQPSSEYEGQGEFIEGTVETANKLGEAISVSWDAWSICELEPVSSNDDIPVIKNAYKVNPDQIWAFKYSLETGSQAQNISRNETQTLGQFPKIGFGPSNYASGSVSALLGNEIVPYSKYRYLERTRSARISPLSTNEKAEMLAQWKRFVSSKNPKLLRDIKGQSWIVQIISSSSTPKNFYMNQPDTIEFQWKQVGDTKNVAIYSETGDLKAQSKAKGEDEWEPLFRNKKNI